MSFLKYIMDLWCESGLYYTCSGIFIAGKVGRDFVECASISAHPA